MKTVVATQKGFANGNLYDAGEEFEVDDDWKASWTVAKSEFTPEPEKTEEDKVAEAKELLQGKKPEAKKVSKKKASKKKVSKKSAE